MKISPRTINTLQDYMIDWLSNRQIERLFEDNRIKRQPYMPVKTTKQLFLAYRETLDIHIREETKLPFIAEAIEKLVAANDITEHPDGHRGKNIKKELLALLKQDGYELIDGKLIPVETGIETVIVESPRNQLTRLYTELKNKKIDDPGRLIGLSKDLLESLFKTICDQRGIAYSKDPKFDWLSSKATTGYDYIPIDCTEKEKSDEYIRLMISNVSLRINELRNIHGYGHGKNDDYKPIDIDSARLVSNMAISITGFFLPKLASK